MSELRWDPVRREWVVTATHRQDRTFKPPKDYCPFCPPRPDGVPTAVTEPDFDVAVVENAFPSLQPSPPSPAVEGSDLHPVEPATGVCEVVIYTPDHDATMSSLGPAKFRQLVEVWRDRTDALGRRDDVEYVFPFENKGEEMGVTLHHPHGQIYAYPFVPPTVAAELDASREYRDEHGSCLFCDLADHELAEADRIVASNDSFVAMVPFAARYAYEVHVYARAHRPSLTSLDAAERSDLGALLYRVVRAYDDLFGFELPFVMAIHQQPATGDADACSHLHVEFYPPYRTADKLKYLAGSELGAGTYINNELPADAAAALRDVVSPAEPA